MRPRVCAACGVYVYMCGGISGVCATAVALPEMGWQRYPHSSLTVRRGRIGREQHHCRSLELSWAEPSRAELSWVEFADREVREGARYAAGAREPPLLGQQWCPDQLIPLCCCCCCCSCCWWCDDDVVGRNRPRSDSRMLLGDAPRGTTRHWPTGWTQSCKWSAITPRVYRGAKV